MDWISKIEEKDRLLAQADLAAQHAEREKMQAEIAAFQVAKNRILPQLETTVAEVQERLGIVLRLDLGEVVITVSAPKRKGSIRQASHPYRFEISEFNPLSSTVRLRVFVDGRIYRNSRPPEGISKEEHYGCEKVRMDALFDLDQLTASGLQLLLEWLVRAHREGGTPGLPQIGVVRPLNIPKQAKRARTLRVWLRSWLYRGPRRWPPRIAAPAMGRRQLH